MAELDDQVTALKRNRAAKEERANLEKERLDFDDDHCSEEPAGIKKRV